MTVRLPFAAGVITAILGAVVLIGWGLGRTEAASLVTGWRLAAVVTVIFAGCLATILWRGTARMQHLRRAAFADLEARVSDRTHALAHANDRLRHSEERLRENDRRKDEFLATLAHELRNLLAPIHTGVQLIEHPSATAASRAQAQQLVDRQIAHMVRLIDDLLDVSRITADKLTLRQERVNLVDVVHQAVDTTRTAIDRARQTLVIQVPADPIPVTGDATRLTQVVANLLQNACKYTPAGGHIEVSAATDGARAEIRVRDDGIGIPAEFQPRLFEKFSQVAPALDHSQGGLGLGLALVHGLVTLHGGSVMVHSAGAGCGSEFIVRLPLAVGEAVATTLPFARTPVDLSAPKRAVLVVDDNEDNRTALAMLLRQRGHVVETAGDGETACVAAERFRPEVVLLDLGLPKGNGFDVCRSIRTQPWGRTVRIIAQTGWGQSHDVQRCEEAGFDEHLVKPIDPSRLETLLRDPAADPAGRDPETRQATVP